jgi:hypothetical protein
MKRGRGGGARKWGADLAKLGKMGKYLEFRQTYPPIFPILPFANWLRQLLDLPHVGRLGRGSHLAATSRAYCPLGLLGAGPLGLPVAGDVVLSGLPVAGGFDG